MTAEAVLIPPKPSLAARFNDWLNPIVVKELRQAVQSRFVITALLILLAIQIVAVAIYLISATDVSFSYDAGQTVFMILFGIMLAIAMLFVPLYSGVRLAAERSETNLDLLFITTIKPRSIIIGKMLAAVVLTILIFSACLPFLTFTYFLRGIDLPSMVVALAFGFIAVVLAAQIAIFIACLPVNRAFKFILGLIAFGHFISGYIAVMVWSSQIFWRGIGSTIGSSHFWQWAGIIALNFGCHIGLLLTLSIALIKPVSANRALPVRLFITIIWAIGGAAAFLGSWVENTHDPVIFWQACFNILFGFSILTAISERDLPGHRVTRAIPESFVKRYFSFFFFSGSASGLTWTVAMIAKTYIACWIWWRLFPNFSELGNLVGASRWLAVMNLYLLCYSLTAAFLRRHLLKRIGMDLTWLVATLLIAIGSTIPFLIGMLVFMNDIDWWREGYGRWLIGNPFVWDVAAHRELYLSIGIVWAALAAAFNLHWFLERVRQFHATTPIQTRN
ncbi:MAG: ABC transporter permease [Blastocatellia bacterium]